MHHSFNVSLLHQMFTMPGREPQYSCDDSFWRKKTVEQT